MPAHALPWQWKSGSSQEIQFHFIAIVKEGLAFRLWFDPASCRQSKVGLAVTEAPSTGAARVPAVCHAPSAYMADWKRGVQRA